MLRIAVAAINFFIIKSFSLVTQSLDVIVPYYNNENL